MKLGNCTCPRTLNSNNFQLLAKMEMNYYWFGYGAFSRVSKLVKWLTVRDVSLTDCSRYSTYLSVILLESRSLFAKW